LANIRDLRHRITSVGNIQKITRAMEMVATTKLRRFQVSTVAAQPYTEEIDALVKGLSGAVALDPDAAGDAAPLFEKGPADAPLGVLFVGSDKGLCGAYNSNVGAALDQLIADTTGAVTLYVVGKKAMAYAERRGHKVAAYFEDFNLEKVEFSAVAEISNHLVSEFRQGALSGVTLVTTKFKSMVRYLPTVAPFLPIAPAQGEASSDAILEPGGPELLGRLVPRYLETMVFHALLESVTSEYASRRFAMKNATDAAGDMKKDITRLYNRARQAKITSEISEIVSGAEAL